MGDEAKKSFIVNTGFPPEAMPQRVLSIAEIEATLNAERDLVTFVPMSIVRQHEKPVSFAPIINPAPWLARQAVTAEDIAAAWETLGDG